MLPQASRKVGRPVRRFVIDAGLLLAERIAFTRAAHRRLDAAHAAPALSLAGREQAHLLDRMVGATAITELHFRHCKLLGERVTGRDSEDAVSLLRPDDVPGILVTALKSSLPKLDVQFFLDTL
ncbi:hypothetical protein SDC9_187173 [bioreactor metagenome]|uniref:Uncharacterized protein n=1 Tax=bioreactor metagenome TaxID=1076179 RepID=A0A645HKU3_9ZZZZ